MTHCIGKDGRPLRVVGPDNVHHYPSFKRVQLAAVKEKLYNPNLPTLRYEYRDNVIGKLCDEHCKTTTCCTPLDFAKAEMNAFRPPEKQLHCLDITATGKALSSMYFTPQEVQKASEAWKNYVDHSSLAWNRLRKELFPKVKNEDMHFDGAAIRVIKPEIRNARLNFKCEPQFDPNGYRQQMPTPSKINSRYRPVHPIYQRNMSDRDWLSTSVNPQHYDPLVYKP